MHLSHETVYIISDSHDIVKVRVHNDSCSIPSAAEKMKFNGCYDEFSSLNEDHNPFGILKGTA